MILNIGDRDGRKNIAVLVYGVFAIALFSNVILISDMGIVMWMLIIIVYVITIMIPEWKNWQWKLLCGFTLLYQEELISIIVGDALHFWWNSIALREQECITSAIALITIGVPGYFYKKSRNYFGDEKIAKSLQRIMVPLIIFVNIQIMLIIVCLNYMLKTSGNIKEHILFVILCIFAFISVGILFAIVVYVKNVNSKMEQMLKMEQRMKQLEIEHYESLLRREENTRKYRHDVVHHLIHVQQMIHNREIEAVEKYVGEMLSHIQHIRDCVCNTGNKSLDTILNYYITQLSEKADVSVKGKCRKEIQVSEYDMSIIFSNLIKNAIEAIQASNQISPMLSIEIEEGKAFVRVTISNSMKPGEIACDESGNLISSKHDKNRHGIGIMNVKDAIRRNGGTYEWSIVEGKFCCQVSLRVKNSEKSKTDN